MLPANLAGAMVLRVGACLGRRFHSEVQRPWFVIGSADRKTHELCGFAGRLSQALRAPDHGCCRPYRLAEVDLPGVLGFEAIHGKGARHNAFAHAGDQALKQAIDVVKSEGRE